MDNQDIDVLADKVAAKVIAHLQQTNVPRHERPIPGVTDEPLVEPNGTFTKSRASSDRTPSRANR